MPYPAPPRLRPMTWDEILLQLRGMPPTPEGVEGPPMETSLPSPQQNLDAARQIGAQVVPPPDPYLTGITRSGWGQQHPALSRMFEGAVVGAASGEAPGTFAGGLSQGLRGMFQARQAQEAAARQAPYAQLQAGMETMRAGQQMRAADVTAQRATAQEQRDAAEAPLRRRLLSSQVAATDALTQDRLRDPNASLAEMRSELADLESIPEAQRTPEQAHRVEGLRRGLASTTPTNEGRTYTPSAIQEYEYAQKQGFKGTLEDWLKVRPSAYGDIKFIPGMNQATGQIQAYFPTTGRTETAPAGITTPTNFGKIADATRSFETTDAMLNQIEKMASEVITSEGVWDGFQQSLRGMGAQMPSAGIRSQFPKEAEYIDTVEAFSSMMSRAAGETGNLATSDVQRIINAVPNIIRDPKNVAENKIKTMRTLYATVVQGAVAAYSSGRIPGPEQVSAAGEGGVIRDGSTGRRWIVQNGQPRPLVLGE